MTFLGEKVLIGKEKSVMVFEIRGGQIRLGMAPADIQVLREKLARRGEA